MLKTLLKGLLARLLAYSILALGFWFLYQGFLRPNIPLGILGGGMVLAGMYLMAILRRMAPSSPVAYSTKDKEDNPGDTFSDTFSDTFNGGHQSDKLSP